jgi:molecular chaperone GrpE
VADEEARETAAPDEGEAKKAEVEDPLALKDQRIAELTDDLKRLQADFDNYKKRVEKEWNERSKLATQKLMTDLLAVLDSFEKAIEDAKKNSDKDSLKTGLEGLQRQLLQTLQREGLKEIKAEGKFDPFVHEALTREERSDVEEGEILEIYQKGYALGQRPLRPTRVKVAKKKEPAVDPEENGGYPNDTKTNHKTQEDEEKDQ